MRGWNTRLVVVALLIVTGGAAGCGEKAIGRDPLLVTEPCKFLTRDDAQALLSHDVYVPFQNPACAYTTEPGYGRSAGQAFLSVQVQRRIEKSARRRAVVGGTSHVFGQLVVHQPVSDLGVPAAWAPMSINGVDSGTLTLVAQPFEIVIGVSGTADNRATAAGAARSVLLRVPPNINACAVHLSSSGPTYLPNGCTGRRSPLPPTSNDKSI